MEWPIQRSLHCPWTTPAKGCKSIKGQNPGDFPCWASVYLAVQEYLSWVKLVLEAEWKKDENLQRTYSFLFSTDWTKFMSRKPVLTTGFFVYDKCLSAPLSWQGFGKQQSIAWLGFYGVSGIHPTHEGFCGGSKSAVMNAEPHIKKKKSWDSVFL